jgi:hypothetical protein
MMRVARKSVSSDTDRGSQGVLELALSQEQNDLDNMPEDLHGDEEEERAEDVVDALERAAMVRRCDHRLPDRHPKSSASAFFDSLLCTDV